MHQTSPPSSFLLHHYLGLMVLIVIGFAVFHPLSLSFFPHFIGIIGCLMLWKSGKKIPRLDKNIPAALATIFAVTFISIVWSITPDISLRRSLKIGAEFLLFLPFFILLRDIPGETIHLIKSRFAIPLIAGALFLIIELTFNFPITHIILGEKVELSTWQLNKHTTTLILLAPFGILFSLQNKQKIAAAAIVLLCGILLLATVSQTAQLTACVMVMTVIGHRLLPRMMLPLCLGGAAVIFILMPWVSHVAYDAFADKVGDQGVLREACASQRLEIWDFISTKALERPWTGFGIDATRSIEFHGKMVYYKDTSILHPHNIALQLWIEFGILGPILACAVLAFLYRNLRFIPTHQQLLPLVIFSGCMVVMLASWSIWSGWLIGLILLLVSLCQFARKPCDQKKLLQSPL